MDSALSCLRIVLVAAALVHASALPRPAHAAPPALAEVQALMRAGRFADAEERARVVLREVEQISGPESLEAAEVLDALCEARWRGDKGGDPETSRICEKAAAIKAKLLGLDDPAYAASLYQLGFLRYRNGDYAEARPLLERALAIREASLGPNHPDVATSLAPLGALVSDLGDNAPAESMFVRALRIREAASGPDSPEAAECIEAIATIRYRAGDFAGSIPMHERALHIWERGLGPENHKVATCLNNLGAALSETGDYEGALACAQRSLDIRTKTLGPDHEFVATSLVNCGNYLADLGDPARARERFEKALSIEKARFGADSHQAGSTLARIGLLLLQQGRFREARPYLERAADNLERGLGPDHPELADAIAALAIIRAAEGDTASAWPGFERAIAIRERSLGPAHPDVGLVLTQYARALAACGRHDAALEFALRGEDVSREHLRLTTRSFAERQALDYAAARPAGARIAASALLAIPAAPPESIERVWDSVIRARTLVLDEIAARHRTVSEAEDSSVVRLRAELGAGRRRLANLLVAGPRGDPPERYRAIVDRTRRETERTERALAARSATFRREERRNAIGFRDVAPQLPRDAALVAYALAGDSSSLAYLAFVLPAGGSRPAVVRVGSVSKIDAAVYQWLADVSGRSPRSRASGARLRGAIWDPLADYVRSAKRVFIVPEGTIHLVSFAAFPDGPEAYLLESGIQLHYLSAERDLVPGSLGDPSGAGLLVVGDPAFGRVGGRVGGQPDCVDFASIRFRPLPQTGLEARDVVTLWGDSTETLLLTGAQATEPSFESAARGRKVLHVATHGFFIAGDCVRESGTSRGIGGVASSTPTKKRAARKGAPGRENPLLLSGLAFAGANRRAAAKPDEEDGVLTAEEIATLDLTGVDWAVLSACDTGRGRIRAGEGVLGLRRAFQIAGAATVIMSLWAVEDESARAWMKALYEGRVVDRLDTADAVARASLRVLRERRARARSTDPFYWAAFVAAGDWR